VKSETVEESGYMEEDFVLSEKVSVTPADIREFQLAKSAVASAVECLLKRGNVNYGDIEKMYVAGGFSAQLNVENAAYLGLVPKELADSFAPVNNSSLLGAVKFACEQNDLADIVKKAEFIRTVDDVSVTMLVESNMNPTSDRPGQQSGRMSRCADFRPAGLKIPGDGYKEQGSRGTASGRMRGGSGCIRFL
jgi:uncharacterized 2Fe-2S/4Fe-4S cluster protein (DUF4445 family)